MSEWSIDQMQMDNPLKSEWKKWAHSALSRKKVEGEYKMSTDGKRHHMKTAIAPNDNSISVESLKEKNEFTTFTIRFHTLQKYLTEIVSIL